MKRLTLFLLAAIVAAPAFAGRSNCSQALVDAGVCRAATEKVWYLSMTDSADVKLQSALARKGGWTATVTCTQAMVDLAQCTAEQIGASVPNPQTERNAARKEFKRILRDELIRSLDAELIRADSRAALEAALAAIADPDLGD
ncbi:MAG: hypothetical protein BWX64_01612 [Acidobacteria bacterium ADurb.Bin051]|nr:MAG: hypothetical protein BWX64_01612 [Acidobacteria bacterium ADurb.Bin051]